MTPIQQIDQSVDDISPVQYLNMSGGARARSEFIHQNLTQQLNSSYQKTRNAVPSSQGGSFNHKLPTQNSIEEVDT